MRVRRVKSEDNLADIGTKVISNKIIRKHAISMGYIDAQENLKTGDVTGLGIEESEQADQSSSAQKKNVIGVNWWPCQTAAATVAAASVAKTFRVRGHRSGGVVTMNVLQDVVDEGGVSSTTVEAIKVQ